jgi:2,3-bisphosphoglycerate-independent phosphoglycerate mutase
LDAIEHCRSQKTRLHLLGLLQTQGVHSHLSHLFALLDLCAKKRFHNVDLHLITDGRDAPVTESLKQLAALEKR